MSRGRRGALDFSPAKVADAHLAVFEAAALAYSKNASLWRRFVTGCLHRARLEWRWRAHHWRTVREWVKAGRRWLADPAR